jgi:hypothetical protein
MTGHFKKFATESIPFNGDNEPTNDGRVIRLSHDVDYSLFDSEYLNKISLLEGKTFQLTNESNAKAKYQPETDTIYILGHGEFSPWLFEYSK